MDFELDDALLTLQDTARRFADEEIIPHAAEWDQTGEFPVAVFQKAWELGLKAIAVYRDGCKRTQPLSTSKDQATSDGRVTDSLAGLTDDERAMFQKLNAEYVAKHGFPFIIAVRDNTKASIKEAFERRINNDSETEFAEACKQVERIGEWRLKDMLPS